MMPRLMPTPVTTSPIGLDIGSRSVKGVQVRRRAGAVEMVAQVQFARPAGAPEVPGEDEIARIEGVLYRHGFVGSRVALAAPRSGAFAAEVEAPPRGRGVPIDAIVHAELARVQRAEPGTFEHTFWDLPAVGRRHGSGAVMAVGIEREGLIGVVDRFQQAGLDVVAVDLPGLALARAASIGEHADPFLVVVDLGFSAVSITVVHQDTVVYEREAPAGALDRLERRLAERLGVDADLASHLLESIGADDAGAGQEVARGLLAEHAGIIAEDIRASIGYAAHRYRTDPRATVVACGGGAELVFGGQRGADMLGVPVRVLRPSVIAKVPGDELARTSIDHPVFMLAAALAGRFDR